MDFYYITYVLLIYGNFITIKFYESFSFAYNFLCSLFLFLFHLIMLMKRFHFFAASYERNTIHRKPQRTTREQMNQLNFTEDFYKRWSSKEKDDFFVSPKLYIIIIIILWIYNVRIFNYRREILNIFFQTRIFKLMIHCKLDRQRLFKKKI